jgi:acetylornithine deacetylase/succinyl-diaminopimelate desuccinylase-like protein
MKDVLKQIEADSDRHLAELKEFLGIPSVSADRSHQKDMERCAQWVKGNLDEIGLQKTEIIPTPGHPIVYGEWLGAKGKPTLLIYGHYDVQPVDPIDLWDTGPFEPSIRDGKIYARGAVDDKGQVLIHLKAAEAHLKTHGALPVNVKFLIEGEEEVGSDNLEVFISKNLKNLHADAAVISDTTMFDRDLPTITYGLRGIAYFQIDLQGANSDLHSGSFGGAVANPGEMLSRLLSAMKDDRGHVTIPGFYDDVVALSEKERDIFRSLPFDEERYRRELGVEALWGEEGFSTLERVWARPTFEVHGLLCGFTGEGAKTVLPAKAMAKVSMRLVANQDAERIADRFEEHLRALCPPSVSLRLTRMHGGKPSLVPIEHPAVQAGARALEKGFGREPVFIREGGSIPVVATFTDLLKIPTVLVGFGLPGENAHAPNENFDLSNFRRGIVSIAHLYDEMARTRF